MNRFIHLLLTRRNTEREREKETQRERKRERENESEWIQREESDSERILRGAHEKE